VRGVGKERVRSVLKLQLWVMKFTVNLQQEIVKRTLNPDTRTKIIYLLDEMWNCNEIARSFDFRNIANCIQIVS
jgi:hypothetical protein